MENKNINSLIYEERKKFIEELVNNSIVSKDQLKTEELENTLARIFFEIESIIKSKNINNISEVYNTIVDNFFTKIDLIVKNTPGLSIGIKDIVSNGELYIYCGKINSDIDAKKIDEDTRFDLASVSKLFTAVRALKSQEKGKLSLQKDLHTYENKFVNLKNIKLENMTKFYYQINTNGRLDDKMEMNVVDTREQLLSNLYNSKEVKSNTLTYSDIPYIILGEILNKVGEDFESIFHDELGMLKTSYDTKGTTITGGNYGKLDKIHDPKAQKMVENGFIKPGHAGVYSTSEDLTKLGIALLGDELLTKESKQILTTPANNERQFYKDGELKNRNRAMAVHIQTEKGITESDIAIQASKETYAMSGTTGPYILIDPTNKFTFNYCCNPYSKEGNVAPIKINDNGEEKRWAGVTNIIKTELVNLVYELRFARNLYKQIALSLDNQELLQETEQVFGSKRIIKK